MPCAAYGNTAQFPPNGLSTAPAAAARHLRCQNARQYTKYYLRFWLSICRTSLAVSALRIMRYCLIFLTQKRESVLFLFIFMRYNKISMVGFAHNREEIESMANEKILVVDDDKNICELLRLYLVKEGYNVTMAHDGAAALTEFDKLHPDLVLLDVMMPVMDCWETCRKLRAKSSTPIIMLTAKGETYDKVLGLELGADDYIVKPFDAKEVTARIKAVLRRTAAKDEGSKGVYDFDNLHLDMSRYELKVKGKVVEAPPKELELLACLAGHPNRVYTRDQLLDEVWGFEYYGDSRTIDVHVKRLREKLEGASDKWSLKTVWGVGYKFEVKE